VIRLMNILTGFNIAMVLVGLVLGIYSVVAVSLASAACCFVAVEVNKDA